MEMEATQAP
ncbi:Protein of unknown function [Escherichia coli D6-113.11]|nr:Protein of unknown function [Escherichia coli D6-113.11]CDU33132.1 Protein of unknown function [Escherichia coli D6-113.11]